MIISKLSIVMFFSNVAAGPLNAGGQSSIGRGNHPAGGQSVESGMHFIIVNYNLCHYVSCHYRKFIL